MAEPSGYVQHLRPAWSDRANFVIHARLPDEGSPKKFEQLRVRRVAQTRFEICCIPFFLYDLSLGDVVETSSRYGMRFVSGLGTRRMCGVW
ncbi:DUF4265 domain-containing protein [Amycolatopsis sacchari]